MIDNDPGLWNTDDTACAILFALALKSISTGIIDPNADE